MSSFIAKSLLVFSLVAPSLSFGSFIANCKFDVELLSLDGTITQVGHVLMYRRVTGKIIRAENNGMSHINCKEKFEGLHLGIDLLAKKDLKDATKTLGSLQIGQKVLVTYSAFDGLTPWGVVSGADWWLEK